MTSCLHFLLQRDQHRRCQSRMYPVLLLVICSLSPFVIGSDYLVAVHGQSSVRIKGDESGGSVRVSYVNFKKNRIYQLTGHPDYLDVSFETQIGTELGYDASTTLISCSNSANNLTVYGGTYDHRFNVFSPLPVTALGTKYVVSSCIQTGMGYSVLVITAYKLNADVAISFVTNVELSYDGQKYGKGDTFRLSLNAYQTFNFRVRYDLSGTRIDSSEAIAVFSGTANSSSVDTYAQLLPVELFSDEFVVAVDGSLPPFQLQVISEHGGFELTFNNGTSASTNSSIINRLLVQNEVCYFRSSKPVMATLCRSVGNQKGLAVLLPTALYTDYDKVDVGRTTVIVSDNTSDIDISHPFVTSESKNISNTSFEVDIISITTTHTSIYFAEHYFGTFISFGLTSFYTSDLSLATKVQPIIDSSEACIVVSLSGLDPYIVAVGDTEAPYQVKCPGYHPIEPRRTFPYARDYFSLSHQTMCILESNERRVHFFLQDSSRNKAISAPILPVSSLGKTYVIPNYDASIFSSVEVVIATGNWTASVDVTHKAGTVTRYELGPNESQSVKSEVAGITVSSSHKIAVFAENKYKSIYRKSIFHQLTPSEDFGYEYVLTVGTLLTKHLTLVKSFTEEYYVNIMCFSNNTIINFHDGVRVIIGETKFYHKDVTVNGNLHFTSSRPVMAHLCLKAELRYGNSTFLENPCTILPPVERYGDSAVVSIPKEADLKIITKHDTDDLHAFLVNDRLNNKTVTLSWKNISNTDYKVGSAAAREGTVFMKSSHKFTVIVNGFDCCSSPEVKALFSISTSPLSIYRPSPMPSASEEDKNVALIVGCVCGTIVLVFGSIVGFIVFRKRRNTKSKSSETRKSPDDRGTSSGGDQSVPETPEQGSDVTEVHTYSDLNFEGQTVNEYQKIDHKSDKQTSDYTNM